MKLKKVKRMVVNAVALTVALTLAAPMALPACPVNAEELENLETQVEDGETDEETSEEIVVEDKDYVVYIDVADTEKEAELDEIANETTDENVDCAFNNQSGISENTISENAVGVEAVAEDMGKAKDTDNYLEEVTEASVQESVDAAEEVLAQEGKELLKDEEAIIYTTDLSEKEMQELQESDATIIVEENIELFGAGKTGKAKEKSKEKSKEQSKEIPTQKDKEQKTDKKKDADKKDSQQKTSAEYETKMEIKQSDAAEDSQEPEWNISMVNGDVDTEVTGEAVKVAVMDSGIELLSGIPVEQINNLVASEQDLPYYMNDMTGHGTAIAGIINDIAPHAEIYSVKIMDAENRATLSRVVEGIYWCIDNDIDIINMSFGTTVQSAVLEKAIKDANAAGILIVSSAGNGDTAGVEYPAAYEEVIAVGAVNTSAEKTEESAVGEEVELVAPGEQILTDSMLGLETVVSGTSMAAPHVTAAAAVLWQKDKTKSPEFIRNLLAQTANELGSTEEYGNGLVDLEYALSHYKEFAANYEEIETQTVQEVAIATTEEETTVFVEEQFVQENEENVETFEDVDYVEGRWWGGKNGHQGLVDNAISEYGLDMTSEEIAIFKLGAVYPDKVFKVADDTTGSLGNKNWHGGFSVNYIANYRFVTKVAKYAGDKTDCTSTKGQSTECYQQMKKIFKTSGKINGVKWEQIICNEKVDGETYNYSSLSSDAKKKKWRKLFLYGMASHIVTDAFAHSAYCRCGANGSLIKVSNVHKDDDPTVHPTRFSDAQEAMSEVILNYQLNVVGSEIDFSPRVEDWGKKRGYCLRNVLKYARAAAVDSTEAELNKMFQAINYEP